MDAERDTDGTTDAHEGDHTPADGAGTEGEGGKPDTRPGDRLATIRRTLWWIGLALQLPFALTLIHFDTPYLILERILCAIPPRLASDPSSIVGIPALETEWCREFLALVLGAVCWVTAGVMRLVADSPSNHGKETLPVRIFAGIITIIVLMATGITGLFLGIAAFEKFPRIWQRNSKSKAQQRMCGQTTHLPTHNALCELPSWLINECSERPSTHFSFLLIRKLVCTGSLF